MLRICFINNDFNDKTGSGRFYSSLVRALNELSPDLMCKVMTLEGVSLRGWGFFYFLRRLRKAVKDFDIIHALDGWPHGFWAVLASAGLKKKIVITLIGTGAVQPLYRPIKKILLKWVYRRADKLVAVSRNTRAEVLRIIPDLEIEVINHGVDYNKFSIFPTSPRLRGASNFQFSKIQNLKPYILSVGALKKRKGYEYSIKAFAEVAAKFPELKYVIVGNGPERQNLKSQISNLKLQDRVVFFNSVAEDFLIGLYQNAELFILLSQDSGKDIEGFGLVFLEAAAGGRPIVGTKSSGAEDAVFDGRNGILVSQNDHQEAANALGKLLNDEHLRNRFSDESKVIVVEMSWDKVALEYRNIYNNLFMSSQKIYG